MRIYLARPGGPKQGPYTLEQINTDLAARRYRDDEFWAWHDGLTNWVPLYSIGGVCDAPDTTFFFAKRQTGTAKGSDRPPEPPGSDTTMFLAKPPWLQAVQTAAQGKDAKAPSQPAPTRIVSATLAPQKPQPPVEPHAPATAFRASPAPAAQDAPKKPEVPAPAKEPITTSVSQPARDDAKPPTPAAAEAPKESKTLEPIPAKQPCVRVVPPVAEPKESKTPFQPAPVRIVSPAPAPIIQKSQPPAGPQVTPAALDRVPRPTIVEAPKAAESAPAAPTKARSLRRQPRASRLPARSRAPALRRVRKPTKSAKIPKRAFTGSKRRTRGITRALVAASA